MPEDEGTPVSPTESYVNPDGTLKEGWLEALVSDDYRGRPVYKAVGNDVKSLLNHIGHQDVAISKQGKGVFVPGPEATQIEKDIFFKATGRPDKPEGYQFAPSEETQRFYEDDTLLNEAKAELHKVGLNQAQFDVMMAIDTKRMLESEREINENPMPYYEELLPKVMPLLAERCEKELREKWGDAYDSRIHLANRAIAENTPEGEERDILLERVGNDPLVADFLATIMNKSFTAAMGVNTGTGSPPASTFSIDQRIAEIGSQLTPELKRTNRTKYDSLLIEKDKLYSQRYPEPGKP